MSTANVVIPDHAPLIYTPKFFRPEKAFENYEPDTTNAYREGLEYALEHGLESAQRLMAKGISHAAMYTDLQSGFRDKSRSLPVKVVDSTGRVINSTDIVVLKSCVRLINGTVTDYFTVLVASQDGHTTNHISFDRYWRNNKGLALDLSGRKAACLTLEDEKKCVFRCYGFTATGTEDIGYFRAQFDPLDSVQYWKHLQATGQGDIWVFVPHCELTTPDVNIHPLLAECLAFASGARSIQPIILAKGHISTTDWFGPLVPCRPDNSHSQGGFRKDIVDDFFKPVKTAEFQGVAEDFCDYFMKRQTMEYLAGTEFLERLRFLTDGTAPIIPNSPKVATLNAEAAKAGIKFISHDTPFNQS